MSSWREVRFGDATSSLDHRRKPVKATDRKPGPYPYYGASGVVDHVDEYLFDGTYLLVSEDGENLRSRKTPIAFLAHGQYWVNNHAHVALATPDFDLRFINYALQVADISGYLTGSTQPKLTAGNLSDLRFMAPDLEEQERIADVLTALDALIDNNRDLIASLENAARLAVSNAATSCSLDAYAAVAEVRQQRPTGTVQHYSLPAFDVGARPEIADGDSIKSNKMRLVQPSVLVSRLNPQWQRCWMAYPGEAGYSSTEFVPLVGTHAAPEEIWAATSSDAFWEQMRSHVTGTTGSHQRVDKSAVLTLAVPDVRTLKAEVRGGVVELVRAAESLRQEVDDVTQARDGLLPLLVSGRIAVNAAKELVTP